jgi:hypothetical protein
MSRTVKRTALLLAGLAVSLAAECSTADAAVVVRRSAVRVATPAPARGAVVHSGTVVRTTPYRPAAGPQVVHWHGGVVRR